MMSVPPYSIGGTLHRFTIDSPSYFYHRFTDRMESGPLSSAYHPLGFYDL
jgi:hypothetical protein